MSPVKVPANLPDLVRSTFNKAKANGDVNFYPTQVAILTPTASIPVCQAWAPCAQPRVSLFERLAASRLTFYRPLFAPEVATDAIFSSSSASPPPSPTSRSLPHPPPPRKRNLSTRSSHHLPP